MQSSTFYVSYGIPAISISPMMNIFRYCHSTLQRQNDQLRDVHLYFRLKVKTKILHDVLKTTVNSYGLYIKLA